MNENEEREVAHNLCACPLSPEGQIAHTYIPEANGIAYPTYVCMYCLQRVQEDIQQPGRLRIVRKGLEYVSLHL